MPYCATHGTNYAPDCIECNPDRETGAGGAQLREVVATTNEKPPQPEVPEDKSPPGLDADKDQQDPTVDPLNKSRRDLQEMTVAQLRHEAESRNLNIPPKALKDDLVRILETADSNDPFNPESEDDAAKAESDQTEDRGGQADQNDLDAPNVKARAADVLPGEPNKRD